MGAVSALAATSLAQTVTSAPGAAPGVVVVFLREIVFDAGKSGISDEESIVGCIEGAIRAGAPQRRVVPYDEFRAFAFPDLARGAAPRKPEYLGLLLQQPAFRARIAPLGIREFVFVGGVTHTAGPRGGGVCVIGVPSGCLGVITWDKRSELAASIVDVSGRRAPRTLKAEASGTSWFAIAVVVPIGMAAMTEAAACGEAGSRVARALVELTH